MPTKNTRMVPVVMALNISLEAGKAGAFKKRDSV